MIKIKCVSVPGGWQTEVEKTEYRFGPVFNKIQDLWAWQRANLFATEVTVSELPVSINW